MQGKKWGWFKRVTLLLSVFLWLGGSYVLAQETPNRLFITGSDVGSIPSIELHVYGMDGQGSPLDLTQTSLSVQHNNMPVGLVEQFGVYRGGTFTLFLIDIPTGVSDQLPAIQDAIIQFASAPTMVEQADYVAVYQVGEAAATELLPPDTFYNSVRNLFAAPLTPETGATALVDSIAGLLDQIESLKPNPDMAASMVVITDGTDVVSTRAEPGDVIQRAADLGIPVHTIWLNNTDLSAAGQERGQNYLVDVAAGSRGLAMQLEHEADLPLIWDRIASFRDQARIRYTVGELTGGEFPVELSLDDFPGTRAETTVSIVGNSPSIVINLPAESRALTLPSLEDPVNLHLVTSVSWLDGVERQLTAAQLVVNGTSPQSIPIEDIGSFDVEAGNLVFGDNSLQVAVLDEQGLRATSPLILLTITEGSKSLPDDLKPTSSFATIVGRVFLVLLMLVVLAGVGFFAWRQGWLKRLPEFIPRGRSGRVRRGKGSPSVTYSSAPTETQADDLAGQRVMAYLDVLESVSRSPSQITLSGAQVRIGRSPSQTDIAFENDITVSRIHASLMLEGNHYRIFDELSTSGTWVNEQQVPEYGIQLLDGDEIHLGAVHLRYRQS